MKAAKAAIMAGKAQDALIETERLLALVAQQPPEPKQAERLEMRLAELRGLAEAALTGAQSAADQMQAILQAARALETYDSRGQRKIADTATTKPHRF